VAGRRRPVRAIAVTAAAAMLGYLVFLGAADMVDAAMGGARWPAAMFATIEAVLAVFGSVWLLELAQRRLRGRPNWGPALSRGAYGAFMVAGRS
jgi:hypothetical protein